MSGSSDSESLPDSQLEKTQDESIFNGNAELVRSDCENPKDAQTCVNKSAHSLNADCENSKGRSTFLSASFIK